MSLDTRRDRWGGIWAAPTWKDADGSVDQRCYWAIDEGLLRLERPDKWGFQQSCTWALRAPDSATVRFASQRRRCRQRIPADMASRAGGEVVSE